MRKMSTLYLSIVILTLLGLYFFSQPFLLVLFLLEGILPWLLHLGLLFDRNRLSLVCHFPSISHSKKETKAKITIQQPRLLLASGFIEFDLVCHYVLYQQDETKHIHLTFNTTNQDQELILDSLLCGECTYDFENVYLYDLFGLTRLRLQKPKTKRMLFYPTLFDIHIEEEQKNRNIFDGDLTFQQQKGNDLTEIFDLCLYQPGDDIRSIHWKLSSKLDQEILKEGTRLFGYQTLVLFDYSCLENDSLEMLNESVCFASSLVNKLVYHKDDYCVGFISNQKLEYLPVSSIQEFQRMLDKWMSTPLPSKKNQSLDYFLIDQVKDQFSYIIYVTNNEFSEKLDLIANRHSVLAIAIRDQDSEIRMSEKGSIQFIEIPYDQIDQSNYTLYI